MRILIAAENASYRFGGEAVLPLHYFARLRKRGIEAWMVVHSRTRQELIDLFPDDKDRLFFTADTWAHRTLFRLSRFLPRRVSEMSIGLLMQLLTQYEQQRFIRQLVSEKKVDVVHQSIPVSPRFPSLLSNVGAPVVIGPMNGGMDYPPGFRNEESAFSRIAVALGRRLSGMVHSVLSGKKQASILLVANERTRKALPFSPRNPVIELVENGVDLDLWSASEAAASSRERPRFLFMGRLVDWKAVDLALEALTKVPGAELEIIGNGPMLEIWQGLAKDLGLSGRVQFSGFQPQKECALRLRSATALLLPSLYECGGAVVLEAMAAGVPVIATNWGGPADYLDATCGVLIDPTDRAAIVQGFAAAMTRLMEDPDTARQMGARGRIRVEELFDWDKKIDRILEIYEQAL
ncbi:MAG TPA: glycosyltransferase family 4 protein [Alloacidobacterium sp.]|nr:glycosyltransferase family 4 protein [Alloacidobacterium sp.]